MTRGYPARAKPTLTSIVGAIREAPKPPRGMSPGAARVWKETAPALAAAGLLNQANLSTLESYCCAVATLRECDTARAKDGAFTTDKKGVIRAHPSIKASLELTKAIRIFASHLGIVAYGGGRPSAEIEDDGLGDL